MDLNSAYCLASASLIKKIISLNKDNLATTKNQSALMNKLD